MNSRIHSRYADDAAIANRCGIRPDPFGRPARRLSGAGTSMFTPPLASQFAYRNVPTLFIDTPDHPNPFRMVFP